MGVLKGFNKSSHYIIHVRHTQRVCARTGAAHRGKRMFQEKGEAPKNGLKKEQLKTAKNTPKK